jgi:hypothetical protein
MIAMAKASLPQLTLKQQSAVPTLALQAGRRAVAKAEAKEREFQTKIDRLREELRAISADWN